KSLTHGEHRRASASISELFAERRLSEPK
ncbi:hypothetical protein L195_g063616, partial [Trifolium pratense]